MTSIPIPSYLNVVSCKAQRCGCTQATDASADDRDFERHSFIVLSDITESPQLEVLVYRDSGV